MVQNQADYKEARQRYMSTQNTTLSSFIWSVADLLRGDDQHYYDLC